MLIEPAPSEGRAVRVLLAAKGMSQTALAARARIDVATLSRLLNGHLRRADLWRQVWVALTSEDAR
jgi:transcriptional regulator with XRE-family HTH domain